MERFWTAGYAATSVRDLGDAMGLGQASVYNAFGDKRALFTQCLDRYLDANMRARIACVEKTLPPRQAIESFLAEIVERSLENRLGCLLVNSALEVAPHDPDIADVVAARIGELEAFFRRCVIAGQRDGSISPDLDAKDVARLLLTTARGLPVRHSACSESPAENASHPHGHEGERSKMIRFYFHPTPNPAKVALFLEEAGLPYEMLPVDTSKGEQHLPAFRAINPNGKVPAIVDTEGPGGREARVFDSSAILLYLADKTGKFLGAPEDRPELLSWLFFIASGLGPFSGQAVHFQFAAPEGLDYARNRYRREAERHYQVLEDHLAGRTFIVGDSYTIADMSAWGWIDRASRVLKGEGAPLAPYPNMKRWFAAIDARPAVARARSVGANHAFKQERDEEALRALFPSNYPATA